ncbi:MAG: ABC transporter substrate-binding protein [bacterium]|nr:ABC transporter substrate-binding protein [bacterium]
MLYRPNPSRLSRRQLLQRSMYGAVGLTMLSSRAFGALTTIRMSCWSQPLSEQTNLFAAQEFGWFAESGLAFKFVPGKGGGTAVKHLLAGNADIAFANIDPLLYAVEQGAKLKAVYNIYPQNVFNVVSLQANGITKPIDLKCKKIGVYSMESGTRQNLRIILRAVGLDESDVEVVPAGVLNFGPLIQGQVDATAATDTGLWLAQQKGLGESNIIWARNYLNTPTDVFIVTEDFYNTRREQLHGFLKAYKRGTQWMIDHPQDAAQMAKKYAINGKDPKTNLEIIKIRNASSVSDYTDEHGLGWFDLDLLIEVEKTFRSLGLTKQHIDMSALFTNDMVRHL